MIVRNLQDSDELVAPHWNIPGHRPNPETTLVAMDNGKVCGISWMAYGGPVGMIAIWFSAVPNAVYPLYRASLQLSRKFGCAMILGHVQDGTRFLDVLNRRGWITNTWKSVAVGRSVDNATFRTHKRVLQGGVE